MKIRRIKGALLIGLLLVVVFLICIACTDIGSESTSSPNSSISAGNAESTQSGKNESSQSVEENEDSSSINTEDNSSSQTEENSSVEDGISSSSSSKNEENSSVKEEENSSVEETPTPLPHIHRYTSEIVTAPDCENAGVTLFSCVCGESYEEYPKKLNHESVTDEALAPTCVKVGFTEGSHCKRCGKVLTEQEMLSLVPHSYQNNSCTVCDLAVLTYEIDTTNGYAVCTGFAGNYARRAIVADEYEGYPVTKIKEHAFAGCSELYSIEIGENVQTIGEGAFSACYHLVEIYDRSKARVSELDPLDNGALSSIAQKDDIHFEAFESEIEVLGGCVIFNDENERVLLYYQGLEKEVVIPEGVTIIDTYAFSIYYEIEKIIIPASVHSIRIYAFYNCEDDLKEIELINPNGWQGMKKENGKDGEWYSFGAEFKNAEEVCKTFMIDYKEYYFRRVD